MLHVLSLGAGVQSTTMALMAAHGAITPMPDCAIFADTQGEPKAVYDHLAWLMSPNVLPFPVHVVTGGNLWKSATLVRPRRDGRSTYIETTIPAHISKEDGSGGMVRRKCTQTFKIEPIYGAIKRLLGKKYIRVSAGVLAEVWVGISFDEAIRKKPSLYPWAVSRWPLLEQQMTRKACLEWLRQHGYPTPPKSSCIFCPYHNDEAWLTMPEAEFQEAVAKEKELQAVYARATFQSSVPYLHPSRRPLDRVEFGRSQVDLFGNECEGACGV